jgi:hypothetical protein
MAWIALLFGWHCRQHTLQWARGLKHLCTI